MRELARSVARSTTRLCRPTMLAAMCIVAVGAGARAVAMDSMVGSGGASAVVGIDDFRTDGGTVSGTLVNKSSKLLRDVRLLIRYSWLWSNEKSPGRNNPGFVEFYTVPGEVPMGGSLAFTHTPRRPLPQRTDGSFDISAQVVGFTEVGD